MEQMEPMQRAEQEWEDEGHTARIEEEKRIDRDAEEDDDDESDSIVSTETDEPS